MRSTAPRFRVRPPSARSAVARVVNGVDVATPAHESAVPGCFLAVVGLLLPSSEVTVVVRLVDGEDGASGVDHRPLLPRAPHEPVVESRASDEKRRKLGEHLARKDEVVESSGTAGDSLGRRSRPQNGRAPGLEGVTDSSSTVRPIMRKRVVTAATRLDGREKVVQEDDIGVDEAAQGMSSTRSAQAPVERGVSRSLRRSDGTYSAPHDLAVSAVPRSSPSSTTCTSSPSATQLWTALRWISGDAPFERLGNGEEREHPVTLDGFGLATEPGTLTFRG